MLRDSGTAENGEPQLQKKRGKYRINIENGGNNHEKE